MQEPFLINPPRRRRRRKSGLRGHKKGCKCVVHARRNRGRRGSRRRSRRNPEGIVYAANKRRRRSRRGRSRRYRRNPGGRRFGARFEGLLPKVGWGAAGAVASEAVPGFVGRFVPLPVGPVATIGVKLASGVVVSRLIHRFVGRAQGNAALVGALLPPVIDLFRTYVGPMIGIGAYLPPGDMGAYLPGYSPAGYLGPAPTVGDYGYGDDTVSRLNPDERI